MQPKQWTEEELRKLKHNDHRAAFEMYMRGTRHTKKKQSFLINWIQPKSTDVILECGSSSGKTCIDFSLRSGCTMIGIDFEPEAIRISTELRDAHFSELKDRCLFMEGDLTSMQFDPRTTKVLMPDFTEHIPDEVFAHILHNIRQQLPSVQLYIYTPDRTHILERLRQWHIMRNSEGHINVKTAREMCTFLEHNGWRVQEYRWNITHIPVFRFFERLFSPLPFVGKLFRRKIAICAIPAPKT